MAEDSGQEKTEDPTPKRIREAREKGDVPRSKELATTLVLMAAVFSVIIFGAQLAEHLLGMIESNFVLDRQAIFDPNKMLSHFEVSVWEALLGLAGVFFSLVVASIVGPIALGGWNFSGDSILPKGSRIDPLAGIKRMFSLKSLVELFKAIAKFSLVGGFAILILWNIRGDILALATFEPRPAIDSALEIIIWVFMALSAVLILVALVDVPYQLYEYTEKMKMTLQEVKDELKNTEGKPEVKGRIRQLQREIAQRQMMTAVPDADVVITNPTHYAVALKYEGDDRNAPIMVAKGVDFVALKIREIAEANDVPILSAPPLARAIYNSTEINDEIPSGLYMAVAQVLAYVFQLKRFKSRQAERPTEVKVDELPIPDEFKDNL
ncbi:flagellar biosynthesis protein FlhB [Neptuniibacter pectenicola]|jgi:flagellar biosynthetic protein FlhB|uniref:Flagellar biosynthetic protein FlhB n=1 Tax=Neptuniibacter pectenicola TaxID=1806669 RepID=A0ABU9TSE1_9GAMM|nr:flagellar biosynthesis protein FlhB [Neptuniibacter pectenicola]KXJ50979.1 MAG: flagellar biosynthetic protein FlhB [Neptuniibacter sp. Phe_28]|tara:strand:+ start:1746 stop:2885 length:1140 start_codon:yes stop_codon:yes gene_type:complete